jgi:hypothetical protein
MYVLLTLSLLLLAAVTLVALRISRPTASYAWLVAASGILLAWISVFFWQLALPVKLLAGPWLALSRLTTALELVANQSAWVYVISLTALAGAVVLTSPVRIFTVGPTEWAGTLTLLALAIVSILADNPLALVLVWTAIDLTEFFITLRSSTSASISERTVVSFSIRAVGTGFALWASVVGTVNGQAFLFEQTPVQAGIFLLLAAGLRLGVLPLHLPYRNEPVLRRGFGTSLRLTTAVTSLVLLARLPAAAVEARYVPYLMGFVALAALYSAWKWLSAPDELSGRPYWIIGMSALAVSATLRGNSAGSAAWGAALVLFGGLSFLYSARQVWFTRVLAVLGVLLLALPFTLTASGWLGSFPLPFLFWPLFLAVQVMLVAGYLRHLFRPSSTSFAELPSWAQAAYPVGLLLPVLTALLLGFWGWPGAFQLGDWVVSLVMVVLAVIVVFLVIRFQRLGIFESAASGEEDRQSRFLVFQERWVGVFWSLYRSLGRLFIFASNLLEGDGGLLWTLLLLVLFISLLQER